MFELFTNKPFNTIALENGSYTVPSETYSSAKITVSAVASLRPTIDAQITNESESSFIKIWLKESDVLTQVRSVAVVTNPGQGAGGILVHGITSVNILINGVVIANVIAASSAWDNNGAFGVSNDSQASVGFYIEEYNSIT